jgi:D-alanine-D-alanine ligase
MIIRDQSIYLIETNTLPGMTDLSILPQEAAAAGISYTKLIDLIIQSGLRNSVYN